LYSMRFMKSKRLNGWGMQQHGRGEKYNILVRKCESKRPLGTPKHKWKDNIRMNLREIRWKGVEWSHVAQDMDQWPLLHGVNWCCIIITNCTCMV